MRSPRSLFWTNKNTMGQRELVEEDDPRQAVKAIQAGEWMADARAYELGIMQYLAGSTGEPGSARRAAVAAPEVDRTAVEQQAAEASKEVRTSGFKNRPVMTPSIEERSYVENAVGQPVQLSSTERGAAGAMGAEITGPTKPEVAQAGSYEAAADKASAEMGGGSQAPAPTEPTKPADDPPKPPEESASARRRP